jgi:arsenate reductase
MDKKKILFLCTGNSCRSQMAEGWARYLHGNEIEAFSAGVVRHGLNQMAVEVMAEAGVDISGQKSKTIDDLADQDFVAVITLCDHANETCPFFGHKSVSFHQGFDDPPRLAQDVSEEQDKLDIYRRVRDEIKDFVLSLPARLN